MLVFDCSTSTGYAVRKADGVLSGVVKFEVKDGESMGVRFVRFSRWCGEMMDLYKPKMVIYEMAHHRGGAATRVCVGFTTRIIEEAERRGIEYTPAHSKSVKLLATGNGNAKKPDMIARAQELYPHYDPARDTKEGDEADALMILHWGEKEFGGIL